MARAIRTALSQALAPLLRQDGAPIIRHDPGILPPGSQTIAVGKGPALDADRIANAIPRQLGQEVYMYSNIHTNQVVYSLTRHLNNHKATSQMAFFGKKTKPPSLRKDMWRPVCLALFPDADAGHTAYRKLLEYKRLHETAYPIELIQEKEGKRKGEMLPKKKRAKVVMDQKANCVADLAAVLAQWERPLALRREVKDEMSAEEKRRVKVKRKQFLAENQKALERWERISKRWGERRAGKKPNNWANETRSLEGVEIMWTDLRDAEFAAEWPEDVVHDNLRTARFTAAWPLPPDWEPPRSEERAGA